MTSYMSKDQESFGFSVHDPLKEGTWQIIAGVKKKKSFMKNAQKYYFQIYIFYKTCFTLKLWENQSEQVLKLISQNMSFK